MSVYRQHLSRSVDLVTDAADIRAGFVTLALERNRRATPFVEQARALKVLAQRAKNPIDLFNIEGSGPRCSLPPAFQRRRGITQRKQTKQQQYKD